MKIKLNIDDRYRCNYSDFELEFDPVDLHDLEKTPTGSKILKLIEQLDKETLEFLIRGHEK